MRERHIRFSPAPRLETGAAPGALIPIPGSDPASATVLTVSGSEVQSPRIADVSALPLPDPNGKETLWVRVTGLGDAEPLQAIGKRYSIPSLALAEVVNPGWRSRMEESGDYLFLVMQAPMLVDDATRLEHVTCFCRDKLLITFEDSPTQLIDSLWERLIRSPLPPRLGHESLYLAYAMLDLVVDRFFPILDQKNNALADLEDTLDLGVPGPEQFRALHEVKRDLLTLRRLLSPYKDLGAGLVKHRLEQETQDLHPYISDLRGHVIQAADLVDAYHEVADSLSVMFQTLLSNRTNDIIRVLTIISTIFMPLSFIVGLYGMNFDPDASPLNMPELRSYIGYPAVLACLAGIAGGMLWYFKRKKWL